MLWIAQQLETDPDNPDTYRLRDEPGQIHKNTSDLPMQKGRYDDWD